MCHVRPIFFYFNKRFIPGTQSIACTMPTCLQGGLNFWLRIPIIPSSCPILSGFHLLVFCHSKILHKTANFFPYFSQFPPPYGYQFLHSLPPPSKEFQPSSLPGPIPSVILHSLYSPHFQILTKEMTEMPVLFSRFQNCSIIMQNKNSVTLQYFKQNHAISS